MKYPFSRSLGTMLSDFSHTIATTPSAERTATLDQASYILLFVASHLARYRPEAWKKIVEGQGQDTSMVIFRRIMENTKAFYHKVASSVLASEKGIPPRHLLNSDHPGAEAQLYYQLVQVTSL